MAKIAFNKEGTIHINDRVVGEIRNINDMIKTITAELPEPYSVTPEGTLFIGNDILMNDHIFRGAAYFQNPPYILMLGWREGTHTIKGWNTTEEELLLDKEHLTKIMEEQLGAKAEKVNEVTNLIRTRKRNFNISTSLRDHWVAVRTALHSI